MDRVQQIEDVPEIPKIHYVCTGGCGTVTDEDGRCTFTGCYRFNNPLNECNCKNGKHGKLPTLNVLKGAPLPPGSKLIK